MSNTIEVRVPDIGNASDVTVIEVLVKPGDPIKAEQTLITLESDKASMEIPAPGDGIVQELKLKVGDKVAQDDLILLLKAAPNASPVPAATAAPADTAAPTSAVNTLVEQEVKIPDLGSTADASIIEINVKPGDEVKAEQTLLTLEGEKATMEVPAPYAGKIQKITVNIGDKVNTGSVIAVMQTQQPPTAKPAEQSKVESTQSNTVAVPPAATPPSRNETTEVTEVHNGAYAHASPGVRRIAREFGVTLSQVRGSGNKGRVLKEDVQSYVKSKLAAASQSGMGLPSAPQVDFSKFGTTRVQALSRIKKLTGTNLHRNWLLVPHVTQFIDADITELETFRKTQQDILAKQGIKLTPLVFIMKAVVAALKAFPQFNASLDADGGNLILKQYYNIGIAVDTPEGLVVPVIRAVDSKSLVELAQELAAISLKAREQGLSASEMQGGCFTISSLGGIGGQGFTPIVNLPEVAILGVSKAAHKPVYQGNQFVPRLMLPLSLSYDHRVIDGAEGTRFAVYLAERLADIRQLLL